VRTRDRLTDEQREELKQSFEIATTQVFPDLVARQANPAVIDSFLGAIFQMAEELGGQGR
jgi:hypothetical protein